MVQVLMQRSKSTRVRFGFLSLLFQFTVVTVVTVAYVAHITYVAYAAAPPQSASRYSVPPDLPEYRSIDKAVPAKITLTPVTEQKGTGYLGLYATLDPKAKGPKEGPKEGRLVVREVSADSPAALAGIQLGDVLLEASGVELSSSETLREIIQVRSPGDRLLVTLYRSSKNSKENKLITTEVILAATSRPQSSKGTTGTKGKGTVFFTAPPYWKQPVYRLGVVLIEYPDTKTNDKISKGWESALFSSGIYTKSSPTGEKVFGSLQDYFHEQSHGKFRVVGKVFSPVQVSKKRNDYVEGSGTSNKSVLPTEALGKLLAREGKEALDNFDGLCFIYSGSRRATNRGSLYYPHIGALQAQGKRWYYMLCPEGGATTEPLGTFALEFAKLLGLPSLAARTENAGSEGLGKWCLMSEGAEPGARPFHLSVWCKEQLGWLTPVQLDPRVPQKLVLRSVQESPRECFKILVRLDGSEYFLLENRTARGFDTELPGTGLLIWRVSGGRPILEESHGVAGPRGPTIYLDAVPYPSSANRAFTPLTIPSSRSLSGGGLAVFITNIRRLPDDRVTLMLGYEYH